MAATRSYRLKPSPESQRRVRAVIETVNYHGCTITLRSEVTANGSIRGCYEVVANTNGATWVFKGTSEDCQKHLIRGVCLK